MHALFFRIHMRIFAPIGSFGIAVVFHSFVRTFGWKLLVSVLPAAEAYFAIADRTLSVITGVTGLWLANVVAIIVLDKTFSKVLKSSPLAKKLLPLLKYAATVLVWGFGAVFILSLIGVNVSALLTGAGIGGLVFALASKELASNLFGSLSLIFGHFFKIHDRIRIKGFEGTVEEITLSYTRITDKNGHTVFMPNKYLTAEPIENLTESFFKSADIPASVPHGTSVAEFAKSVSDLGKGLSDAKTKVSVTEMGATETKVTVRVEAPANKLDEARAAVIENISKVYAK